MDTNNQLFKKKCEIEIDKQSKDKDLKSHSLEWALKAAKYNYVYHFSWLGRPIIQYPQDMIAMQELIWRVKPDLIIETGIAHGGSLIFSASMLAQLDICEAIEKGINIDPSVSNRKVIGIDIDIREHNRVEIDAHPMRSRIEMLEGSSIDSEIIERVKELASNYSNIMILLDSNHTHDHVLAELNAYAQLTSSGSYCVVFDTVIEDMPDSYFSDRPWGKGNNPKTAVLEFLSKNSEFEVDKEIENKLGITVAPNGFLYRK